MDFFFALDRILSLLAIMFFLIIVLSFIEMTSEGKKKNRLLHKQQDILKVKKSCNVLCNKIEKYKLLGKGQTIFHLASFLAKS